jgi:hypothetical protein
MLASATLPFNYRRTPPNGPEKQFSLPAVSGKVRNPIHEAAYPSACLLVIFLIVPLLYLQASRYIIPLSREFINNSSPAPRLRASDSVIINSTVTVSFWGRLRPLWRSAAPAGRSWCGGTKPRCAPPRYAPARGPQAGDDRERRGRADRPVGVLGLHAPLQRPELQRPRALPVFWSTRYVNPSISQITLTC